MAGTQATLGREPEDGEEADVRLGLDVGVAAGTWRAVGRTMDNSEPVVLSFVVPAPGRHDGPQR